MKKCMLICLFLASGVLAQESAQEPAQPPELQPAQQPELQWIARHDPVYPQMARIAHIQGDVWIAIELDPEGRMVALRPLSSHPILVQAATESLKLSKVFCRNCDGKNAVFSVLYRFKVDDPPKVDACAENPAASIAHDPLPVQKSR